MKYLFVIAGFFLYLEQSSACNYRGMSKLPRVISLSKIQSLQMGKTTIAQLQVLFGKPDKVKILNKDEECWGYRDYKREEWDNLSTDFSIDRKKGVLKSVTWKPMHSDPLAKEESVLAFFKNVKFISQDDPEVQGFSIRTNQDGGISFGEIASTKRVVFISLGISGAPLVGTKSGSTSN